MKKNLLTLLVFCLGWGAVFAYASTESSVGSAVLVKGSSQVDDPVLGDNKKTDSDQVRQAVVEEVEGRALLTRAGNPVEEEIASGDLIGVGDSVYTVKGASLTISLDDQKLNTVKIPAESQVVFVSIDPAEIELKDGSIFNSVDGLPEGSTWKISTPAAVAAVRGTQFEIAYSQMSGEFSAATFDDSNADKISAVQIESPTGGPTVEIQEGKEMVFGRGQPISRNFVKNLSVERAQRGQQMVREVAVKRKEFVDRKKEREHQKGSDGPGGGPGGSEGLNRPGGNKGNQGMNPNHFKQEKGDVGAGGPNSTPGHSNSEKSELQAGHNLKEDLNRENHFPSRAAENKIQGQAFSSEYSPKKPGMRSNAKPAQTDSIQRQRPGLPGNHGGPQSYHGGSPVNHVGTRGNNQGQRSDQKASARAAQRRPAQPPKK